MCTHVAGVIIKAPMMHGNEGRAGGRLEIEMPSPPPASKKTGVEAIRQLLFPGEFNFLHYLQH